MTPGCGEEFGHAPLHVGVGATGGGLFGLVTDGGQLNEGLRGPAGRRRSGMGKPEGFPGFVGLPVVAFVEEHQSLRESVLSFGVAAYVVGHQRFPQRRTR